ncbi:MAG: hypothetical protein QW356_07935 [Candidatus Hadarchaeales archaeon]
MTETLTDTKGRKYYYCQLTFSEIELSPWIFKELRPSLVEALIKDMRDRWILEPITCYQEGGKIWLANGKHRYEAAKKHDEEVKAGKINEEEWMKKPLEARVYIDLAPGEIPEIVMALDDVRKKAAAGERLVGLAMSYSSAKAKVEEMKRPACDEEILSQMGYVKLRMKYKRGKPTIPSSVVREVILAHYIDQVTKTNPRLAGMIRARQLPRKKLEVEVRQGRYPLFTRENLAQAFKHLIRDTPTSANEVKSGDPRELEYKNFVKVLELLVDHVIIPLAQRSLDQAVGICSRFMLEAVGLGIKDILVAEYKVSSAAPLMTKITDWQPFIARIERLKQVNWADPALRSIRSAYDLYQGYGTKPISGYIFP